MHQRCVVTSQIIKELASAAPQINMVQCMHGLLLRMSVLVFQSAYNFCWFFRMKLTEQNHMYFVGVPHDRSCWRPTFACCSGDKKRRCGGLTLLVDGIGTAGAPGRQPVHGGSSGRWAHIGVQLELCRQRHGCARQAPSAHGAKRLSANGWWTAGTFDQSQSGGTCPKCSGHA